MSLTPLCVRYEGRVPIPSCTRIELLWVVPEMGGWGGVEAHLIRHESVTGIEHHLRGCLHCLSGYGNVHLPSTTRELLCLEVTVARETGGLQKMKIAGNGNWDALSRGGLRRGLLLWLLLLLRKLLLLLEGFLAQCYKWSTRLGILPVIRLRLFFEMIHICVMSVISEGLKRIDL